MGTSPSPVQVISAFHTLQTILVEPLPVLLVKDILKAAGNGANGAESNEIHSISPWNIWESMFVDWDDGDDGDDGDVMTQICEITGPIRKLFRVQPHQGQR